MEIKINKEIRDYKETIFFGLSMRQFSCAAAAVGVAVGLYLLLHKALGRELVSWFCIAGAAPIAAAGFFRYHGMTLEKFLWAWFKSEVLLRGPRVWRSENYLYRLLVSRDDICGAKRQPAWKKKVLQIRETLAAKLRRLDRKNIETK